MGKAGRRKRDDLAYESFDGAGCSTGLQFELAPTNESGFAGVFPTTSGRWQATVRVEREGKKVRRNVGSFDTKEEAALQRALALKGTVDVLSPAARAARRKGARHFARPFPFRRMSHTWPSLYRCDDRGGDVARSLGRDLGEPARDLREPREPVGADDVRRRGSFAIVGFASGAAQHQQGRGRSADGHPGEGNLGRAGCARRQPVMDC